MSTGGLYVSLLHEILFLLSQLKIVPISLFNFYAIVTHKTYGLHFIYLCNMYKLLELKNITVYSIYVYVVTRWTRELFLINRAYIDEFKSDDVIFSDILKRQNLMRWVG